MKRKWGYRNPTLFVLGQAAGAGAGGEPPPRPDHPTRPHRPDTPTRPMQRGKSRCKRMQADASGKARRQGAGSRGKGQGGRCPRQKAQKEKALAFSAWSHVVAWSYAPRLFCAFGSVAPPCPFDPSPLPLAPLLLRLHSVCIPLALRLFFPFAFRFHSAFIPCASLGVSGGRVVGSGCRVCGVGSGGRVGVAALPLPRSGGCKVCGCSPLGSQPLLNRLTSAVGQL